MLLMHVHVFRAIVGSLICGAVGLCLVVSFAVQPTTAPWMFHLGRVMMVVPFVVIITVLLGALCALITMAKRAIFARLARTLVPNFTTTLMAAEDHISTVVRDGLEQRAKIGTDDLTAWKGDMHINLVDPKRTVGFVHLHSNDSHHPFATVLSVAHSRDRRVIFAQATPTLTRFQRALLRDTMRQSSWSSVEHRYTAHAHLAREVRKRAWQPQSRPQPTALFVTCKQSSVGS